MKYLPKLVLLTLFANAVSCTNSTNKQPFNATSFVPNLVQSHIEIRKAIKPFNDSISYFGDTAVFFSHLHPVMTGTDQLIGKQIELIPTSRMDSLAYAAGQRLNSNYQMLIHLGYRDLFEIYNKPEISKHQLATADSIMTFFKKEDSLAVNYFNSLIDSSSQKLDFL